MKTLIPLSQTGDTIIEVLLSMSILALVLTATFVSTNHSLQNGTDSSNRQQALALAQQQVELIKTSPATYQSAAGFCAYVDPTTHAFKSGTPSGTQCQNANGQYTMTDTYDSATGLYTVVASWPSASSSGSQLTVYYRIPIASAPVCPAGDTGSPPACVPPAGGGSPPTITVTPNITIMGHPDLISPTLTILANGVRIFGPKTYSIGELTTPCTSYSTVTPPYASDYDQDEVCLTYPLPLSGVPAGTTLLTFDFEDNASQYSSRPGCSMGVQTCYEDNNILVQDITIPGYKVTFNDYHPGDGEVPAIPAVGATLNPYTLWMNWDGKANFTVTPN